jgi:hypothetical protein
MKMTPSALDHEVLSRLRRSPRVSFKPHLVSAWAVPGQCGSDIAVIPVLLPSLSYTWKAARGIIDDLC